MPILNFFFLHAHTNTQLRLEKGTTSNEVATIPQTTALLANTFSEAAGCATQRFVSCCKTIQEQKCHEQCETFRVMTPQGTL